MKKPLQYLIFAILVGGGVAPAQDSLYVRRIGQCNLPWPAYGMALSGNLAYLACAYAGLHIIDISNPAAPFEIGSFDTPDVAAGIAVNGNYAYIADGASGLRIIDISNPSAPVEVGSYNTPGGARDVAVSANHAFVADGGGGLRIINVSNPAAPTPTGHYALQYAAGVEVVALPRVRYVHVADGYDGLRIINAQDLTAPTLAGSCPLPGWSEAADVSGFISYVAAIWGGLNIINVFDPTNPSVIGAWNPHPADWATEVAASGNYACISSYHYEDAINGPGGIRVIDVRDHAAPVEAGHYIGWDMEQSSDVVLAGNLAYVAGSRFTVYDLSYFSLVPRTPGNLIVQYVPASNVMRLRWNSITDPSSFHYAVYRSLLATPGQWTSAGTASPPDTLWQDNAQPAGGALYYVTAVRP